MSLVDIFFKPLDLILERYVLAPRLVNIKSLKEIRFECVEDCGECCKKGNVCVAKKELQNNNLQEKLEGNLYTLEKKYQKGTNLLMMRGGEIIKKKTKTGECIFLNENKCSIYSNKPIACNSYPISVDPFDNEVYIDTRCRGVGNGKILLKEDIEKMAGLRRQFWEMINLSQSGKEALHKDFARYIRR